jgi:PAS domain S-box-containing protein
MQQQAHVVGTVDYRNLFEAGGGLWLVLLPDLTIAAVSDAYLHASMAQRAEVVGRNIFEVFPASVEEPSATGTQNLRMSLERVLQTRMVDVLAFHRYDLRRPTAEGGEPREQCWSVVNTPVFGPEGALAYILLRVEDIKDFLRMMEHAPAEETEGHGVTSKCSQVLAACADTQQKTAEWREALRRVEEQYRERTAELDKALEESEELFESAPSGRAKVDAEGRFVKVNKGLCDIVGYSREELLKMRAEELACGEDRDKTRKALGAFFRGEVGRYTARRRYVRKDGKLIWVEITVNPIYRADGTVAYASGITTDVTEKVTAEEALRESEQRFRATFENAPIAMTHMDLDGRWIRVNPRFCEIMGYESTELLNTYFAEVSPPDEIEEEVHQMACLRRGEIPFFTMEKQYTTKDGRVLWLELTCALQRDSQGRPEYYARFAQDITERKRAQDAVKRQARLIDLSPDGILSRQPDGTITFWSKGAEALYGWTAKEAMGRSTHELLRTHFDVPFEVIVENLRHAGCWTGELVQRSKDGRRIVVQSYWVGEFDERGQLTELMESNVDISERKRAEEELARSNEDLQQFGYIVSHDLQEPLRMVSSYLQLLEQRYKDQLDQNAHDFIDFAVDGANRMSQLIKDLLQFSRVGMQSKEPEPVALTEVLAKATMNLSVAITEASADISVGPLPTVRGDPVLLVQLFQNLLGNALKFRAPDRSAIICIGAERSDNLWRITIADQGIGIAPQYQQKIFQIFKRLHTRKEYPGTGIGLAICKKIVERHGGRIWVDSQPGQGAAFHFTLPPA